MPSPDTLPYQLMDLGACPHGGPLADAHLLQVAAQHPVACLWSAPQCLVVPRTYAAKPGFAQAQQTMNAQGWPVYVRQSGGGVVPQGAGILNLSLARLFSGRPLDHSEDFYQQLCSIIASALLFFGIEARAQAVEGSFCDGRFNLAVGNPAKKIAGTAQWWRRQTPASGAPVAGTTPSEQHIGLVHALILLDCDTDTVTRQANALEEALGSTRRYRADRIVSLDTLIPPENRAQFQDRFHTRLIQCIPGGGIRLSQESPIS
ncbi:lipoyl protein ligase domain-containing protein [Castellaniella sp.]|uniref:lipoyl protein ligase domain-containing protein n=1 Tax=Castellaniella sp. TaxID=1955812 RepID=UPI003C73C70E